MEPRKPKQNHVETVSNIKHRDETPVLELWVTLTLHSLAVTFSKILLGLEQCLNRHKQDCLANLGAFGFLFQTSFCRIQCEETLPLSIKGLIF